MTILKFRVWDKVKKKMYGVEAISFVDSKVYPVYTNTSHRYVPFDESVLMQSTGMKDKNSVDIYENDIVVEEYRDLVEYGRVFYSEERACYRVEFDDYDFDLNEVACCFVHGNVYENPDLLDKVGIV